LGRVKRLIDLLLISILLGAGGIGAYFIGHRVDHLSNQAASQDSELNSTTTVATHSSSGRTIGGHHVTPLLIGVTLAVIVLALIAASVINAAVKARKRERWRVT
jgi:hypothetical protein